MGWVSAHLQPKPSDGLTAPAAGHASEGAVWASLPEVEVLRAAHQWIARGEQAWMATVVETYGSAPRPVGSIAVLNQQGQVMGSVSGGCVEDDLADWLRRDVGACVAGTLLTYGNDAEERHRLRLPCNGHIRVWLEPATHALVSSLSQWVCAGQVVCRQLNLSTGTWTLDTPPPATRTALRGDVLHHVLGPRLRAVLIGAGEVSRYLAPIALTLGFKVEVIDPREEYTSTWPHPGCTLYQAMPDDILMEAPPDARTAVLALSHDPKIDDLALMEALKVPCLYVGAMGSVRTTMARRERLTLFELSARQLEQLHGPVGADIGARTPPEIAVSIASDLVAAIRRAPQPRPSPACRR